MRMERRILIVYKSATGFTRHYAEIAGEALGCKVMDYSNVTVKLLAKYDTVVYGTRAHAGTIDGFSKMRKLFLRSGAKQFVLFVTGAMPNAEEEMIAGLWKQNLSAEEIVQIPHFYMQGGLCYERMSFPDKLMMKGFAAMMRKKKDKSENEKALEKAIARSYDISDRKYAVPLIDFLKAQSPFVH